MRTVNDVIKYVNDIKPNAFTDDTLTEWLSECEGSIQTEILCIASGNVVTYNYADNKDTELIVKPPHDKLYGFYLLAMIDFAHGEYKKYENTMQLFNAALSEFAKWFVRTHSKEAKNPEGYYMSGYDLAVKHGYSGTEEEWLKTLIGPQGVQGIQGEKGDRGIPGKIQSVTSGDNGKILVDGESVVVYDDSEIKNEIGGKVDKVQGKGLSSNDYTAEEKTKLSDLPDKQGLDTLFELENNKINAIQALATQLNISKVDKEDGKGLSANDFTNEDKETLNNSASYSDFQSLSTEVHILYKELKDSKEDSANKVTTLNSNSTDKQYPSAKAVYDELVKKLNANEAVGKKTERVGEVFNDYINNEASSNFSHAEGYKTTANSECSHAEGESTIASNTCSHAEGNRSTASGNCSHAENLRTQANGSCSHAEGESTIANGIDQHVQGAYNKEDTEDKYAHIVGNGTSDSNRSNAHTLDWNGNAWYQGDIRVGGTSYDDGKTLETKTTIVKSTETSPSITLADNTEFIFTEELEDLEIALPQNATEPYICSVVFNSGETPTGVVYTTGSIYFKGINCTGSTFTPTANKHYTLMFVYDSMELICYVSAKPINEVILFSTADTDEASVMSDESTAEETESVAEEPESEPNEVI